MKDLSERRRKAREDLLTLKKENYEPSYRELSEEIGIPTGTLYDFASGSNSTGEEIVGAVEYFLENNSYDADSKKCIKCLDTLPRTAKYFGRNKNRKDGLTNTCRVCLNRRRRDWEKENHEKNKQKVREYYENLPKDKEYKKCSECGDVLKRSKDNFYEELTATDGLYPYCKACNTKLGNVWRENNKEKRKQYNREYYQKNAEKLKKRTKKFREENPDYVAQWVRENSKKEKP